MAKPPELVRSTDDELRIKASFPNGRYTFSLRPEAKQLLTDLGYSPGDTLPWYLFKALALIGDAWLPNTGGSFSDELAVPDAPTTMRSEEAAALADHLQGRRVGRDTRERLSDVIAASALDQHLSVADFEFKEDWIAQTDSLLSDTSNSDPIEQKKKHPAPDKQSPSLSLLHIGKTTLGRKNMGRVARKSDYLDAFAQAVDTAIDRQVDAVLQTGHLFQSRKPDRETVSNLQTELEKLKDNSIPFYFVCGPKEAEIQSTVLESLARSGFLKPIGGQTVELDDGLTLVGIDDASQSTVEEIAFTEVSEDETLLVACGGTDVGRSNNRVIQAVERRTPSQPIAFFAGKRAHPVCKERAGMHLLDPGSIEHILSQSTIEQAPPECGVNEYSISDGTLQMTRHELDTRSFSTFEFEVTGSTTLDSIRTTIERHDLQNQAVLAVLTGSGSEVKKPSRKAVQSLLGDHAYCARVYDDRAISDSEDEKEEGPESATADDSQGAALQEVLETVMGLETEHPFDVSEMETATLADRYALFSKAKSQIDDLRTDVRDELASRVGPDETVAGEFGKVVGTESRQRSLRDDETVTEVLRNHGVPAEQVTVETFDPEKIDQLLENETVPITEEEIFEITESKYIRRQELDLEDGVESKTTTGQREAKSDYESKSHKVYLGNGAPIGGWIPVERSVVEDEIVPLIKKHRGAGSDGTISVNFSSDVSISGWSHVDADVVTEQVMPLVKQYRTD